MVVDALELVDALGVEPSMSSKPSLSSASFGLIGWAGTMTDRSERDSTVEGVWLACTADAVMTGAGVAGIVGGGGNDCNRTPGALWLIASLAGIGSGVGLALGSIESASFGLVAFSDDSVFSLSASLGFSDDCAGDEAGDCGVALDCPPISRGGGAGVAKLGSW